MPLDFGDASIVGMVAEAIDAPPGRLLLLLLLLLMAASLVDDAPNTPPSVAVDKIPPFDVLLLLLPPLLLLIGSSNPLFSGTNSTSLENIVSMRHERIKKRNEDHSHISIYVDICIYTCRERSHAVALTYFSLSASSLAPPIPPLWLWTSPPLPLFIKLPSSR
jgi:hypothetical protein